MNRQDTSHIAVKGENTDQVDTSESTSLERRRALLSGLGKSGALMAAVAPVTSFAAERVRTADGKQCTVSGQMSAVMSQAASASACAAYHPTSFFDVVTVLIEDLPAAGGVKSNVKNGSNGQYFIASDAVYYRQSSTNARKLTPANRPTGYTGVGSTAASILTGATGDLVLKVLHSASESDTAYFLAAFFSAALTAPAGSEKVPFAAVDVQTQWGGAQKAAAASLYRLICTVGKNTAKLG